MNFHEFGLGIGWVKVFVNVCLLINGIGLGLKVFAAIVKGIY